MQSRPAANDLPRTLVLLDGLDDKFRSARPKWAHPIAGTAMLMHALGDDRRGACLGGRELRDEVDSLSISDRPRLLSDHDALVDWLLADLSPVVVVPADRPGCASALRAMPSAQGCVACLDDGKVVALRIAPEVAAHVLAERDSPPLTDGLPEWLAATLPSESITMAESEADAVDFGRIVDRVDLARVDQTVRRGIRAHWMRAGVTIVDPDSVWIDAGVAIGPDTILLPGTTLAGATMVGAECRIGPYVVATDATIGNGCTVGPFAHLRSGTVLGDRVRIGNFVEVKNARLGEKVAAGHLSYLGDSDVGAGTNIGAGTITCNYDGFSKHRTEIGAGAFIGSHTTLVAPVHVGDGALTAAGSVVTKDVPGDALALARARQENREGWAAARRERRKRSGEQENRK